MDWLIDGSTASWHKMAISVKIIGRQDIINVCDTCKYNYNKFVDYVFVCANSELSMGWVNPRVGLSFFKFYWVGLGRMLNSTILVQTLQKFIVLHTNIIQSVTVSNIN